MAKYLIHACPKRMNYVEQYLVPSMLRQNISRENILIYNDTQKQGFLPAFVKSIDMLPDGKEGTWHIQDDVIISSDFKKMTEENDGGIVCGFCSYYTDWITSGRKAVQDMWYSFPCIRIPDNVAKDFVQWLMSSKTQTKFRAYIEQNKFVDMLFREYLIENHFAGYVYNLMPNIVDNVDYLIGGSVINKKRAGLPVSLYFNDKDLIAELKHSLEKQ